MSDVIISLTTIPPRLRLIGPTLADLLAQEAPIAEVRLYLPRRHRRFPLAEAAIPDLPAGVALHLLDQDWGPGTKVLAAARDLRGEDVEIIFCDDDQHYDPGWAARLIAGRQAHPEAAVCQLGYDLDHRPASSRYFPHRSAADLPRVARVPKGTAYRLRRMASLGRWKPPRHVAEGHVDILEGYRGAMIRPEFLPPEAWEIPAVLWTVDDPWLSGQLHRNGVPIWMVLGDRDGTNTTAAAGIDGLKRVVEHDHGRECADTLAIEYFRRHYGLWPDARPPQGRLAGGLVIPDPPPLDPEPAVHE